MKINLLLSVLILILVGCAGKKDHFGEERLSPESAFKRVIINNKIIESLHGNTRISIETPEEATGFDAEVFYRAPDSLMIKIDYILGADAALLGILGERYIFYNKVNDNFLSGNIYDDFIDAFFQLPIPLSQFSDLIIGRFPIDTSYTRYEVSEMKDNYLFEIKQDDYFWNYSIDPYLGSVQLLEIYDHNKELVLAQNFTKFEVINSRIFPRQIILKRPSRGQYVSIYYKELGINKAFSSEVFEVTIPASTKQLDLDH